MWTVTQAPTIHPAETHRNEKNRDDSAVVDSVERPEEYVLKACTKVPVEHLRLFAQLLRRCAEALVIHQRDRLRFGVDVQVRGGGSSHNAADGGVSGSGALPTTTAQQQRSRGNLLAHVPHREQRAARTHSGPIGTSVQQKSAEATKLRNTTKQTNEVSKGNKNW